MMQNGVVENSSKYSYTYLYPLGAGSYGQVWKAQTNTGQYVAIKVFHKLNKAALSNVKKELDALIVITESHPFCKNYAICLIDRYYIEKELRIVTDFIEGQNLDQYRRTLSLGDRQQGDFIMKHLIIGMDKFHKLNITHQDIKGENIMWDTINKRPLYIDWGLACIKKYCITRYRGKFWCEPPCGSSGTAYTMPPELTFNKINQKTFASSKAHDMWSLGVVLLVWYTFPSNKSVLSYYDSNSKQLNDTAPYYMTEQQIHEHSSKINNNLAQQIIPLLLTTNIGQRLENWNIVMKLLQDSAGSMPVTLVRKPIGTTGSISIKQFTTKPATKKTMAMQQLLAQSQAKQPPVLPPQPPVLPPQQPQQQPPQPQPPQPQPQQPPQQSPQVQLAQQRRSSLQQYVELPIVDPENINQCVPFDPNDKISDIIAIKRNDSSNSFWCFKKMDIVVNPSFKIETLTFNNPFTGENIQLESKYKDELEKMYNVIQLVQFSQNYITTTINIPNLLSVCFPGQILPWNEFYQNLSTEQYKYQYLLPFLWYIRNKSISSSQIGELPKIEIADPYKLGENLTWRFIFDTFDPATTFASVYNLIEQWIDTIIANYPTILDKNSLFCDYLQAMKILSTTQDLQNMCSIYLNEWNNVTKDRSVKENFQGIQQFSSTLRLLPIQWYIDNNKVDELNRMMNNWLQKRQDDPIDPKMTTVCS